MKATTIVCSSFVIQIKSRHDRATMKTPLKASGTLEEPWRGHGKPEARAHGRAVHSDSASRFRLASPRPFLFDSTNVCPSPSSSSFLFSSSFSFSPPPRRTDRTMEPAMYVMHGKGWLIIPGARPKARNPKHFRRTRANGKRARGTSNNFSCRCRVTQGWAVISLNARLENWKWA